MSSTANNCPTGGSKLQVEGLSQVVLNQKLEMQYDRLGVSTVTPKNIVCKLGASNMTSSLCKMKNPAHVMALKATWDRSALVSTCDVNKAKK